MIGSWLMNKILDPFPVWLQVSLVLAFIGFIIWGQSFATKDAAFILHNHTERPISEAIVDDVWIGNATAFNGYATGSGVICCAALKQEKVEVQWRLSVTQNQYDSGVRGENMGKEISVPERAGDDLYLHVHIYPDNTVRLFWSETMQSRFQVVKGR